MKTLGEFQAEMNISDPEFRAFIRGFDLASKLAHDPTSDYSAAMVPWLWGHFTDQIDEEQP